MHPDEISDMIRAAIPDAQVRCTDLTGTANHWQVEVISSHFAGKRLLAQHRMVKDALADKLKDNTIHALSLKTSPPR